MRIFKLQYYEKWQHWMLNEPKSFTPAGNLRSFGYGKAITWISEIWKDKNRVHRQESTFL